MRSLKAWMMISLVAVLVGRASASFVKGIETFPGTTKDSATWTDYGYGSFTQNDGLRMFAIGYSPIGYTAVAVPVAVGQGVRAQFTVTTVRNSIDGTSPSGYAFVGLATDGKGHDAARSAWVDVDFRSQAFIAFGTIYPNGAGAPMQARTAPEVGHTYIAEVDRMTAEIMTYTVSDVSGPIVTPISVHFPSWALPTYMYPLLGGAACDAVFDYVQVVPEPRTFLLLPIATVYLTRVRRNRSLPCLP